MKPILTTDATLPGQFPRHAAGALLGLLLAGAAAPAFAQTSGSEMTLELNAAASTPDAACQLTLVVTNGLPEGLRRAAWQVAVFDKAGTVQSLPVLDFGALLPGKTRVAQFALPGGGCEGLGRIVVNDVAECIAQDGTDRRAACLSGLVTRNRSDIEFGL